MGELVRSYDIILDAPPVYHIKLRKKEEVNHGESEAEEWVSVFKLIEYGNGHVDEGLEVALDLLEGKNQFEKAIDNINESLSKNPPPKYQLGVIFFPKNDTDIIH